MGEDRRTSGKARYTVAEAADMLGIATGAVRIRLARGTLPRVRDGGTVYVLLPADMSPDTERDAGDVPTSMLHGAPDTLKSELRDRLRCLECQVEAERQAHSEARRLLAAALERIPAIEVPQETQESPETVAMSSKVREVSPATGEAQEDVQRPRSAASGVGY